MRLLNPSALWWLALVPPVIILYFMKLKRKEFKIATVFLWQKVMREARTDSFFQKLKVNILLILQIVLIVLIVWALARPYFSSFDLISRETILIVDNSASMETMEDGKTRIEIAKEKIGKIISEAPSENAFMLIEVSDSPRLLSGFTKDRAALRKSLSSISPKETPGDLKPAVLLGYSLLKSHPEAAIFLVGDHFPREVAEIGGGEKLNYISVGSRSDNIAITYFNISRSSRSGPSSLFVKVENFSEMPVNTSLEIYLGENLSEVRQINLLPGGKSGFIYVIPAKFSGTVRAFIPFNDALACDNNAYGVMSRGEILKILLISDGNSFLERALGLLPDSSLSVISLKSFKKEDIAKYGLIVWDSCRVPVLKKGNHIFINCNFEDDHLQAKNEVEYPAIISGNKMHPVMRFIDFSTLAVAAARQIQLPQGSQVLIDGDVPLVFVTEKSKIKSLYINFDLMKSDWPLSPSFPIFFSNAVEYLANRGGLSGIWVNRTGSLFMLNFIESGRKVTMKAPGNRGESPVLQIGGEFAMPLDWVGIYQVRSENSKYLIPANLTDREESNIKPDPPKSYKIRGAQGSRMVPLIKEVWWDLIIVALLVVLLEWYIFHQRRI